MIRTLFVLFILFSSLTANALDLTQIRKEFYAGVNDKDAAEKFYLKLKSQTLTNPVLQAYYGSAEALMGKHAWNPYKKVSYLKSGLRTLELAIAKNPESIEIRFLRFSIEHYLPPFLGLSKNLEEDGKKIVELIEKDSLSTADSTLVKNIVNFLKKTNRFSAREVEILNSGIKNG